jgi:lycopene beta-cyclase
MTQQPRLFLGSIHGSRESILFAVWFLCMTLLPISRWFYGDAATPYALSLAVLAQTAFCGHLLIRAWGGRQALRIMALVAVLAWCVEFIGSKTGFPFSFYSYTDRLQPQIAGVPLLIAFAWLMMLPPSWGIAQMITRHLNRPWRLPAFILCSGLAITAWDLYLDPLLVGWGFWLWPYGGAYFGIPFVNMLGWILAAMVITAVVWGVFRPAPLPAQTITGLYIVYGITWLLMAGGLALFWGLPGPAATGFIGMGIFMLLAGKLAV